MSYKFAKGRECLIVSTNDDGSVSTLQQDVEFPNEDLYELRYAVEAGYRKVIVRNITSKVKKWQAQGYTFFHFFGKQSGELYLIGFLVEDSDIVEK